MLSVGDSVQLTPETTHAAHTRQAASIMYWLYQILSPKQQEVLVLISMQVQFLADPDVVVRAIIVLKCMLMYGGRCCFIVYQENNTMIKRTSQTVRRATNVQARVSDPRHREESLVSPALLLVVSKQSIAQNTSCPLHAIHVLTPWINLISDAIHFRVIVSRCSIGHVHGD